MLNYLFYYHKFNVVLNTQNVRQQVLFYFIIKFNIRLAYKIYEILLWVTLIINCLVVGIVCIKFSLFKLYNSCIKFIITNSS